MRRRRSKRFAQAELVEFTRKAAADGALRAVLSDVFCGLLGCDLDSAPAIA
jgi:hypothetical protein